MKKLFTMFLVAGVLFSLSAGVSWFLQPPVKTPESEEPGDLALKAGKKNKPLAPANDGPAAVASLRPALRAPQNADTESVVQMANSLRNQLDAVRTREQQLSSRQKNLDLVFQDMRKDREDMQELQKKIGEEMKALLEKISSLEQKNSELNQQRDKVANQVKDLKKNITEIEKSEQSQIKQMAAMYDSMEPESAAQILMHMADTGKMDTAVKILSTMRERQAARILASIEDRAVTVQIMDRLKDLKRPATASQ